MVQQLQKFYPPPVIHEPKHFVYSPAYREQNFAKLCLAYSTVRNADSGTTQQDGTQFLIYTPQERARLQALTLNVTAMPFNFPVNGLFESSEHTLQDQDIFNVMWMYSHPVMQYHRSQQTQNIASDDMVWKRLAQPMG